MIKTTKKINLNQLDKELGSFGLDADWTDEEETIIKVSDESPITDEQLKSAIDVHIPIDDKAKAKAEKAAILDRLGLTEDELKTILG